MITFIGIDLGQKGAMAVQAKLAFNKPKLTVYPFWQHWGGSKLRAPTDSELHDLLDGVLHKAGEAYVAIEHPVFMPLNGKKAIAGLHEQFGLIKGILHGLGATSFVYPKPVTWKKLVNAPGNDKFKMVKIAQRLFKSKDINAITADAVLISEYCRLYFRD